MDEQHQILLYDGVCGLCNRFVRFVLERDRAGTFRFAALQSEFARAALARHGLDADALETVYVLRPAGEGEASGEAVLARSAAVLFVLSRLGRPWAWLRALGILPAPVLDLGYRLVARYRYRLFGRSDACRLPEPGWTERFIASE